LAESGKLDGMSGSQAATIEPTFRVPLTPPVRNLSGVVGRAVAYSNLEVTERIAGLARALNRLRDRG
jgi:hypothetical protein